LIYEMSSLLRLFALRRSAACASSGSWAVEVPDDSRTHPQPDHGGNSHSEFAISPAAWWSLMLSIGARLIRQTTTLVPLFRSTAVAFDLR
jgi:hypothetical protein